MKNRSPENKPVYVTQPAMPELDEYTPYLEKIWKNKILTNNGPFHRQLENELADFLGVPYISLFANGTLALVTALQCLEISGEVITTPYSFVATTHSLWWNNIKPVFADIDPLTCNLDPDKIEPAITPETSAIMPVHVYGNPCEVEKIEEIARQHSLKVIYDAAHAFGVNYKGESLLNHGNLSILSFHATKVFNTMEGGAIISHDRETKQRIDYLKNFGFDGETKIILPGINSKMNEMQAALGLIQLKYHNSNIEKREKIAIQYKEGLAGTEGIGFPVFNQHAEKYNYAYFPIFIDEDQYGKSRDELYFYMQENNIFGRRYFYPLISHFPPYSELSGSRSDNLPNAEKIAHQVICLPIYPDLSDSNVIRIIKTIRNFAK